MPKVTFIHNAQELREELEIKKQASRFRIERQFLKIFFDRANV